MKKLILRFKTVPRWIILLIDMLLLAWAFSLSYFIAQEFRFPDIPRGHFAIYTGLYCLLALPVLVSMRVHTGLIRYSNTRDMLKIFSAMLLLTGIYLTLVLTFVQPIWGLNSMKVGMVLLINFFVASSSLIILRLVAKNLYYLFMRNVTVSNTVRVLIYGSDRNAIMAKQALENSEDTRYLIVGFVDTVRGKLNSYIEQKRVYHIKDLSLLKEKYAVDRLVLVNDRLGEGDKKVIIERCLRLDIKVLTVPPAENWASGRLRPQQIKNLRIEDLLQREPIKIDNSRVREDLKGKRILVTGAAGSIGSEIVRQILQYAPAQVILCDQAESPLHEIQLEIEEKYPLAETVIAITDIRNPERMHNLFEEYRPQLVFHAAAYKHVPMMENNPKEAIGTNVEGTKNVADLSVLFGVEKFVMISTDKAVNPTNVMGASKRIAEIYTQSLDNAQPEHLTLLNGQGNKVATRFITTRFGNVLGSNGSVIPRFRAQIEKGGPVTVTHPDITRYFMTIPEAVQLVLEAGTMGKGGEIYVFDMGKPVRIVDLAEKMIRLAGLKPGRDIEITFTGLRRGEKLYEELLNADERVMPTHHEKISIARVIRHEHVIANRMVKELIQLSHRSNEQTIVRKMKEIVPEFVSKNSPFEGLNTVKSR
jgi:FlaA1/EpsC-like NDP-sugar epimerase